MHERFDTDGWTFDKHTPTYEYSVGSEPLYWPGRPEYYVRAPWGETWGPGL